MLGASKQNALGRSQQSPGAPQLGFQVEIDGLYVDSGYVNTDYVTTALNVYVDNNYIKIGYVEGTA
jgi:hypothetical protein